MESIEEHWQIVQTKTFTKWVNSKLQRADMPLIRDLFKDLSNGTPLVNLLKAIGRGPIAHNPNAISRIQKLENLSLVLDYIKSQRIVLINIGPTDIVDGNHKLILGLIWTIISRMSLSEALSNEFYSMREELLEWVRKVTASYDNVDVKNFTTSWKDGLAFNAIIHKFRPNLIPNYNSLDDKDPEFNMKQAFTVAELHLDIPRLLDPEDIIHTGTPDEKSIMTYISQFYQKFKSEEQEIVNRNIISAFLRGLDWSISAKNVYERKARNFIREKEDLFLKVNELKIKVEEICKTLKEYEKINSDLIVSSCDLSLLLNNIQDTEKLFNLKEYKPSPEISGEAVDIDYIKPSLSLDLSKISQSLRQFENKEAVEIENSKKALKNFLEMADKSNQIAKLSTIESKVKSLNITEEAKSEIPQKFREFVEDKKAKLQKFTEVKQNTESMINNAKRLFKISDAKNTGQITFSDFKKILKALKLNSDEINENKASFGHLIGLETLIETVSKLYSPIITLSQIKTAFNELNNGEPIDIHQIVPNVVFKNIVNLNNGKISFDDVKADLIEE